MVGKDKREGYMNNAMYVCVTLLVSLHDRLEDLVAQERRELLDFLIMSWVIASSVSRSSCNGAVASPRRRKHHQGRPRSVRPKRAV